VPARYRVRLHGRTVTVWDSDPSHAGRIAQEWLDFSDKSGIDPSARVSVELIPGELKDSDLLGTIQDVPPTHPALATPHAQEAAARYERVLVLLVSMARRLFRRNPSSPPDG
jgi:hypothetical protein